jgi:hypothetical protein
MKWQSLPSIYKIGLAETKVGRDSRFTSAATGNLPTSVSIHPHRLPVKKEADLRRLLQEFLETANLRR